MAVNKDKTKKTTIKKETDLQVSTELERLLRDMNRPDMEKLQLFTQMLRTNSLLKKAIINHK